MNTEQKTCPVCEHWNDIIAHPDITELEKSQAIVALSNHQYFKHFKEPA